jgi:hypothetical protein
MTLDNFHPLPHSPWNDTSQLGLRGTVALFIILSDITPLCNKDARVGFWRLYSNNSNTAVGLNEEIRL